MFAIFITIIIQRFANFFDNTDVSSTCNQPSIYTRKSDEDVSFYDRTYLSLRQQLLNHVEMFFEGEQTSCIVFLHPSLK